jgi:hypothetical protein
MWSLVVLITFIHVFVDCIAREPNQGESSSRPQRHHWNPDIYRHDSLCCESQFSFKKQTPYVFKDSILLLLNPTLQYLNFHFLQSALDPSCTATTFYMKVSKYPLPGWTTVWPRLQRPPGLDKKKTGNLLRDWPEDLNKRRTMQMCVSNGNGGIARCTT